MKVQSQDKLILCFASVVQALSKAARVNRVAPLLQLFFFTYPILGQCSIFIPPKNQ